MPPSFAAKTELARYIRPIERVGDNHAAATAFQLSDEDRSTPETAHLSVNALEVEQILEIVEFYRSVLQDGSGDVAVCVHKVHNYIDHARKLNLNIQHSSDDRKWVFDENGFESVAFKLRQISPVHAKNRSGSSSHCGVEFLRAFDEHQERRWARRMARRPRFHVYTED